MFVPINDQYQYAFFHVPKTGGCAVKNALMRHSWNQSDISTVGSSCAVHGARFQSIRDIKSLKVCGAKPQEREYGFLESSHPRAAVLISKFPDIKSYLKFGFVRNPWDRFASAFMYLRDRKCRPEWRGYKYDLAAQQRIREHGGGDMKSFIRSGYNFTKGIIHMRPQKYFLFKNNKNVLDFTGRYETLQKDYDKVCRDLNLKTEDLRLINKTQTKNRHYSEYYDNETREAIGHIYKEDIEYFGYSF